MDDQHQVDKTADLDTLETIDDASGVQPTPLPSPPDFYKELVKFAIYFAAFLLPLFWALDDLSKALQDFVSGYTHPYNGDPTKHTINTNLARSLVVILFVSLFAVYWFGRNFVRARKTVHYLLEVASPRRDPQTPTIQSDELNEKKQYIRQLSLQIEQQRHHLRKIHEEMYDDKVRVRHDFISFRARYKVNAQGDIDVSKEIILKSPELEVHFWRFYADGGPFADPLDDDTRMELDVRALGDNTTDVIAILLENEPTRKVFTVNFLPTIQKNQTRSFMLRYRWPGFFKEFLETSQTQYYWDASSYSDAALSDFSAEWHFDEALGDVRCEIPIKGDLEGMKLRSEPSPSGSVWVYSGRQVPLGNARLALKIWR